MLTRDDIDALILDFDGVLTDNRVLVLEDGTEAVFCNRSDGLAFDRLREAEMPTFIVSTERNPVVQARGRKLRVPVLDAVADKAGAVRQLCVEHSFDPARLVFVGNDINDLPAMQEVGYPIAVGDAHPRVKAIAWRVLRRNGGEAIVRELIDDVIKL